MTTEQLVGAMRQRGFYLDLDSRNPHDTYTNKYSARFWQFGDGHVDYVYANTIDKAIRWAATTVSKRHGLDLDASADKKSSEFTVWAFGLLWGLGIILLIKGIAVVARALQ
jgi:hypothetical protein